MLVEMGMSHMETVDISITSASLTLMLNNSTRKLNNGVH